MAFVESVEPSVSGHRRLRTRCPVSHRVLKEFDVTTAADVAVAMERARTAQAAWAKTSFPERTAILQRALAILIEKQEAFIDRIVAETGRSRMETTMMEIFAACDSLNFYSRRAERMLRPRAVGLHLLRMKRAKLTFTPLGVVGVITPWNGPFILSLNPTVQALMAGNAVLIKPSEVTPDSGVLVGELFAEAGLPDGLVQILLGDGETGAVLIDSGVDKISFTGSVAIDRAVGGAVFGGMMNGGQFCSSTERIYVVEAVAEEFIGKLTEKVAAL